MDTISYSTTAIGNSQGADYTCEARRLRLWQQDFRVQPESDSHRSFLRPGLP